LLSHIIFAAPTIGPSVHFDAARSFSNNQADAARTQIIFVFEVVKNDRLLAFIFPERVPLITEQLDQIFDSFTSDASRKITRAIVSHWSIATSQS
jgi:hypothetical protein